MATATPFSVPSFHREGSSRAQSAGHRRAWQPPQDPLHPPWPFSLRFTGPLYPGKAAGLDAAPPGSVRGGGAGGSLETPRWLLGASHALGLRGREAVTPPRGPLRPVLKGPPSAQKRLRPESPAEGPPLRGAWAGACSLRGRHCRKSPLDVTPGDSEPRPEFEGRKLWGSSVGLFLGSEGMGSRQARPQGPQATIIKRSPMGECHGTWPAAGVRMWPASPGNPCPERAQGLVQLWLKMATWSLRSVHR